MLPVYQLPTPFTADEEERERAPMGEPSAPILPRLMVPAPEVKLMFEEPSNVPSVILSLDVVMERAPLGVVAPSAV